MRADPAPPLPPAPPPSGAPARALLPLPFPRRRARAPGRLAPSRFPLARETPSPSASRRFLAPRSSLSNPDTAGLPPARQRRVPCFPIPLASCALRWGPSPGLSPFLPPNSPSGRCHHVEASAATTDLPAPAAAPHATGRGPPASWGHQPSQRRPPGAPRLHLGSPRASRGHFPLPGACSRCRERAPPGTRGHLGASAAATAAATTSGEARGSGHRQRQVRKGVRGGFPGAGAQATGSGGSVPARRPGLEYTARGGFLAWPPLRGARGSGQPPLSWEWAPAGPNRSEEKGPPAAAGTLRGHAQLSEPSQVSRPRLQGKAGRLPAAPSEPGVGG